MTAPVLIVTGMSGAGKSTVLKTLEDLGWEVVDNLPLRLLGRLLEPGRGDDPGRPLAIGLGTTTRDFDPARVIGRVTELTARSEVEIGTLFLDCAGAELERRYAETRRRHPLADDRPAADGIARERELLAPLRDWANRLIDTTALSAHALAAQVRATFAGGDDAPVLSVTSFGFSRGVPRNADLVFDMRFLRNPHWVPALKPGTGLDPDVAAYVAADPAYEEGGGADRDADRAAPSALSGGGQVLCHRRDRLYRRETPVRPRRRADRRLLARPRLFAHGDTPRPSGRAAGRAGRQARRWRQVGTGPR